MATKKASSKALVKAGSRAIGKASSLDKQLAQFAQDESSREKSAGGNKLSIKGGKFTYQGATLGKKIPVVVLAYTFENAYYDVAFDPDNPSTPACFALDKSEDDLAPHADAPVKQCETVCADCGYNAWGSSDTGSRGKKCTNRRRIICISADEKDYATAELATLGVGPSSLKNWKGYVKGLNDKLALPPFAVITSVSFDEDADYEVLQFNCDSKITDKRKVQTLMSRLDEANKLALQPYDASGYTGGKPKKKGADKSAPKKAKAKSTGRSKFSR
jgi:hypothetical protein